MEKKAKLKIRAPRQRGKKDGNSVPPGHESCTLAGLSHSNLYAGTFRKASFEISRLQSRSAFRLGKTKHSKMISNDFLKQWQTSWQAYRSTKSNPVVVFTTPLSKARLRVHEGLAKAESSQILTEKIGLADFLHRYRVPTVTSPAYSCG